MQVQVANVIRALKAVSFLLTHLESQLILTTKKTATGAKTTICPRKYMKRLNYTGFDGADTIPCLALPLTQCILSICGIYVMGCDIQSYSPIILFASCSISCISCLDTFAYGLKRTTDPEDASSSCC